MFSEVYYLLKNNPSTVLLEDGARLVLLLGDYQGRVMTSSSNGMDGFSYGWVNLDLIKSGLKTPHMNAYGGEERFWLGPEGGQFSIYFEPNTDFEFQNWQTPSVIDTENYPITSHNKRSVTFEKEFEISNYSETQFKLKIEREISLLSELAVQQSLSVFSPELQWVAYQSENRLTNIGKKDWSKKTGLLSIWLLGMLNASDRNTIIIPYQKGKEQFINDSYFGKVPSDRLVKKDGILFFKADAKHRSKIGIGPEAIIPLAASYDAENGVLTILQFEFNGDNDYVNSMWEIQNEPYKGDFLNAYNDGENALGSQMGNFYELESSSAAKELKRNETLTHIQRTFHFHGEFKELNVLSKKLLGTDLTVINSIFS